MPDFVNDLISNGVSTIQNLPPSAVGGDAVEHDQLAVFPKKYEHPSFNLSKNTTYTITHNLGNPLVSSIILWDGNDEMVDPSTAAIHIVDANALTIDNSKNINGLRIIITS